jgi:hypothetical protein
VRSARQRGRGDTEPCIGARFASSATSGLRFDRTIREPSAACVIILDLLGTALAQGRRAALAAVSPHRILGLLSLTSEQLLDREPDVASNLTEQRRRDILALVERNRSSSTVGMPVLPVRSSLTRLNEPQPSEKGNHFPRLQDWDRSHGYPTWIVWIPTNSDSSFGSPSSRSISRTSCRFRWSSSRLVPWL